MSETQAAIFTPQEAAKSGLEAIGRAEHQEQRGLKLDIAEIRDYFAPMGAGQVCAVIAQTSNYKSGFLHFWERVFAKQLMQERRICESIIHVSVEECLEEQILLEFAHYAGEDAGKLARGQVQDWDRLKAAAVRVAQIPIYRVGDSLAKPEEMANLYLSNIIRSLEYLVSGRVTGEEIQPAAIFVDYLQALPFDPEVKGAGGDYANKRRLQVRQDIYRLRQAAMYFACPVVVAVQAKQKLDGASSSAIQIPGIYDGEESSSIAQRSDRIIQLWMPKMTHPVGKHIEYSNIDFTVEENMLWVKIGKQRGGFPSGRSWLCRVNYKSNDIAPDAFFRKGIEER